MIHASCRANAARMINRRVDTILRIFLTSPKIWYSRFQIAFILHHLSIAG